MNELTTQEKDCECLEESMDETSPMGQLFQLGRKKSYVTYADILRFFPNPEQNLEQLECIFGALLCAGIPYGEDSEHLDEHDQESRN